MLWAFSLVELIWVFAILSVVAFLIVALVRHRQWTRLISDGKIGLLGREIFSAVTGAITFVGFLLTVLDYTNSWRWGWIANNWLDLNKLVFPDLNGTWHGSLSSNTRGEGVENGVCPWLDQSNRSQFGCYQIDMTISMGLFDTDVRLKLGDATSESKGVSLIRKGADYQLMYLFVRTHPYDPPFNGAAVLDVRFDNQLVLEGHYWTDRDWQKGMQTAGYARVRRTGL
jgi:SMODS-associating 2TM, beta-strand rich effector domain